MHCYSKVAVLSGSLEQQVEEMGKKTELGPAECQDSERHSRSRTHSNNDQDNQLPVHIARGHVCTRLNKHAKA